MRSSHSSSSARSSMSRPPARRNHAALQGWPLSTGRARFRGRKLPGPVASTSHRTLALIAAELDVGHPPPAGGVGSGLPRAPEQLVFEPAAVDLMGEGVE